jgi:hypothetical protein
VNASAHAASSGVPPPLLSRGALCRAAARSARRALAPALKGTLFSAAGLLSAAGAALAGFLLTWILARAMPPLPGVGGAAPGAIAGAFLLNLVLLGIQLACLPLDPAGGGGWDWVRGWLRGTELTVAAFLGLWAAPGNGVAFQTAGTLMALTAAQCAGLCGGMVLAALLAGRFRRAGRMLAALLFAFAATGLFWSRPVLYALQRSSPAVYESATQAVVSLGPVTGVAAVWDADPAGFNLIKSRQTYEIWIGANFLAYPVLWPGPARPAGGGMIAPGLILGLLLWGLVLAAGSDYLGFVKQEARAVPGG